MVRRGSRRVYVINDKILKTNWRLFGDRFRCHLCGENFVKGDKSTPPTIKMLSGTIRSVMNSPSTTAESFARETKDFE